MRFKRFTAGIVAAVMAVTAVGTPLCDSLPVSSDGTAVVAGAETYEDFEYKDLMTVRWRLQKPVVPLFLQRLMDAKLQASEDLHIGE